MANNRLTASTSPLKVAIIVAAILLSLLAVLQRSAIASQLDRWKLLPRPERLTELYFTDHTVLPKNYTPGTKQQVKFTVHNIEYRTTDYSYTIAQASEDEEQEKVLVVGQLNLAQDELRNIEREIVPVDMGPKSKIVVTLIYEGIAFGEDDLSTQTQAIHYWVEKAK